jgi:protein-S-isoprenylcysteine O-methyltransferase Ste14
VNNIFGAIGSASSWLWLFFIVLWWVWGAITSRQRTVVVQGQRGVSLIWWAGLIAVLYLNATGICHHFLALHLWPGSLSVMEAGLVLEVSGMCLAIWARWRLGALWSSNVAVREDHHVVDAGPYRLVRHPIYSGILLGMVGTLILYGVLLWLVILAGYAAYAGWKALNEERLLTRELGDEYVRYRSRTRMLIPWLL